jgi:hypothetical protein
MMTCPIVDDLEIVEGEASQSDESVMKTIAILENARTGTCAAGPTLLARRRRLRGASRELLSHASCVPASAEFVVVDLITQHGVQADQQFAGDGDVRLGTPASMEHGQVAALQIGVGPDGV